MEPQPALRRPARHVVLDAVALEDLHRAVVPLDREMDRELALRNAQHRTEAGLELDVVGRGVELREGGGERARAGLVAGVVGRVAANVSMVIRAPLDGGDCKQTRGCGERSP